MAERKNNNGSRRRRVRMLSVAVAAVSLIAILVVKSDRATRALASSHTRPVTVLKISDPVDIPGYGRPIALAADPTRAGVWFLDASATDESIFFWNPSTSSLRKYSFGTDASLPFGSQAALTVDSSGVVWAGIGDTLLRLDPQNGLITRIAIPAVPSNTVLHGGPGGGPGEPPPLFDSHAVQALAMNRVGTLAIAMSFSTSVFLYDTTNQTFSNVALPDGDVPNDLSSLPNGTFVVAASSTHGVDFVTPDHSVTHSDVSGYVVGCGKEFCVTSPDGHSLYTITPSVAGSASTLSPSVTRSTVKSMQFLLGLKPTILTPSKVVVPTTKGFYVGNPSSGSGAQYSLPARQCSTMGVSNPSASVLPKTITCQQVPVDYVIDSAGNIWFTSNFGTSNIYEVSAGTY